MEINPLHLLKRFNELRTDDYMVLRTEFAKVSLLLNYLKHLIRHRYLIKLSITFFVNCCFQKYSKILYRTIKTSFVEFIRIFVPS